MSDAAQEWLEDPDRPIPLKPRAATEAAVAVVEDEYELAAPAVTGSGKLIQCKTCNASIARNAKTCPKCGAPNDWLHPEVQRFANNYMRIKVPSECNYNWSAERVSGFASVSRGAGNFGMKMVIIAGLIALLMGGGIAGPLFMLIAGVLVFVGIVLMLLSMLGPYQSSDNMVEFQMDFTGPVPKWTSTDDKFWADVKRFFRV